MCEYVILYKNLYNIITLLYIPKIFNSLLTTRPAKSIPSLPSRGKSQKLQSMVLILLSEYLDTPRNIKINLQQSRVQSKEQNILKYIHDRKTTSIESSRSYFRTRFTWG